MLQDKELQIEKVKQIIQANGFSIETSDIARPWGGFFRLKNTDAEKFIDTYFADIKGSFGTFEGLSPKYLIVEPGKRLSWQYHDRRAEIWRVLDSTVGVKLSTDDTQPEDVTELPTGELIQFGANKRHRLIGLDDWGVVVEIWKHTDPNNLSDEDDIVRVQDDFGR